MSTLTITLPWPDKALSPNASSPGNWHHKARKTKIAREVAYWTALTAGAAHMVFDPPVFVHMKFIPPTRRRRDEGNLIGWVKAYLDGIADAIDVDDQHFRLTHDLDREHVAGEVIFTVAQDKP
jgi:crossover junction endodeoxyribonuclease RusA